MEILYDKLEPGELREESPWDWFVFSFFMFFSVGNAFVLRLVVGQNRPNSYLFGDEKATLLWSF